MATNIVILEGNLVRDPKTFPLKNASGVVARFTIAVNRASGSADYIDCVAFSGNAATINDSASTGTGVKLTGALRSRSYERNGERVYATEVHVDTVAVTARARIVEPTKRPASRGSRTRKRQDAAA